MTLPLLPGMKRAIAGKKLIARRSLDHAHLRVRPREAETLRIRERGLSPEPGRHDLFMGSDNDRRAYGRLAHRARSLPGANSRTDLEKSGEQGNEGEWCAQLHRVSLKSPAFVADPRKASPRGEGSPPHYMETQQPGKCRAQNGIPPINHRRRQFLPRTLVYFASTALIKNKSRRKPLRPHHLLLTTLLLTISAAAQQSLTPAAPAPQPAPKPLFTLQEVMIPVR